MFPQKPPVANDTKSAIGFLSGAPKVSPSPAPATAIEPDGDEGGASDQQDAYSQVEQLVAQFGADEVKMALDACLAKHGSDHSAAPADTGGGMVA